MRCTSLLFLLFSALLLQLTACGPAIKKIVNNKYPPVSSVEKATASVKNAMAEMEKLPSADLGVRLDEAFLDSLLNNYFRTRFSELPDLGIPQIEKIEVIQSPRFTLDRQELIVDASLKFALTNNKYVRAVWIDFSGLVSPSVNNDSLKLELSFSKVFISKLKLRRFLFLGSVAKNAVNSLCKSFMDNINGQLKTFVVKINYPPFPEVPLSSLIGQDENITVTNDHTFRLSRKTLHPVILIKPGSLSILAGVDEKKEENTITTNSTKVARAILPEVPQPNYILTGRGAAQVGVQGARISNEQALQGINNDAQLVCISAIDNKQISKDEFSALFNRLDEAFYTAWNNNMDALPDSNGGSSVSLS